MASAKVRVLRVPRDPSPVIRVTAPNGDELAEYLDASPARVRFLERTGKAAPEGEGIFDRAGLLERLALFQATEQERLFHKAGMKTQRQSWEESFWHRLAYHCVREFEEEGRGTFHPAIDEASGRFTFTYRHPGGEPVVRVAVPRDRVRAALQLLAVEYPEQEDLAIRPVPLMSIFRVTQETELDLEVRPVIRALQANGEERFFEHRDFERFRYGNLIYIKDLGVLAELEREGKERKFKAPVNMKLQRGQVASFLAENQEALGEGLLVLDEPLRELRVFKEFDRIEISAVDFERGARAELVLAGPGVRLRQPCGIARRDPAREEGRAPLSRNGGRLDRPQFAGLPRPRPPRRGGRGPLPPPRERAPPPPGRGGPAGEDHQRWGGRRSRGAPRRPPRPEAGRAVRADGGDRHRAADLSEDRRRLAPVPLPEPAGRPALRRHGSRQDPPGARPHGHPARTGRGHGAVPGGLPHQRAQPLAQPDPSPRAGACGRSSITASSGGSPAGSRPETCCSPPTACCAATPRP